MLRHSDEYPNMQYRGVKRDEKRKKWTASITVSRVFHFLGEFEEAEEAAIAYDQKAIELLGKYATTNFPQEAVVGTNYDSTNESGPANDRVQDTQQRLACSSS